MKKNIVKTMLKAAATTAMVAAMFVGGNKMEAKAMTIEEFAGLMDMSVSEMKTSEYWMDMYNECYKYESYEATKAWLEADDSAYADTGISETVYDTPVQHKEMLDFVNADRAVNGVNALVWDENLAAYANQRAMEVMNNFHSKAMADAKASGGDIAGIGHSGCKEEVGENASWTGNCFVNGTATEYNSRWINSAGHHANRNINGITKYASASYTDSVTGDTVWVELFEY